MRHTCLRVLAVIAFAGLLSSPAATAPVTRFKGLTSGEWAAASERGEWVGRWTEPDGKLEIGGTYQAQWRKVDGRWLIQGELFVPTHCKGSKYCNQRP